jgi:hypothetical protein
MSIKRFNATQSVVWVSKISWRQNCAEFSWADSRVSDNSENDLLSILIIPNLSNLKILRIETNSFSETLAILNYLTRLSAQENVIVRAFIFNPLKPNDL